MNRQIIDTSQPDPAGKGGNGLALLAKISVSLDGLHKHIRNDSAKRWAQIAKGNQQPILGKIPWSGQCNASGFGIFFNSGVQTEGPDQGHIWFVRHITVLGTAAGSTVTGARFDVFISAQDYPTSLTALSQLSVADWFDGSNAIPNSAFYSRGGCTLRMSESLTFVVSGAPANQQVGGVVEFEDFLEGDIKLEWGL